MINKQLLKLATSEIIINYDGKTMIAQTFLKVKNYNKVFCQFHIIDMVTPMTNISRSKKVAIAMTSLIKIQPKMTMYS